MSFSPSLTNIAIFRANLTFSYVAMPKCIKWAQNSRNYPLTMEFSTNHNVSEIHVPKPCWHIGPSRADFGSPSKGHESRIIWWIFGLYLHFSCRVCFMAINRISKQIVTFTIRQMKQSVAIELPKRNEIECTCKMNYAQWLTHNANKCNMRSKSTNLNASDSKMRITILTAIMCFRYAACFQFIHP
jgi:hypothetical protein